MATSAPVRPRSENDDRNAADTTLDQSAPKRRLERGSEHQREEHGENQDAARPLTVIERVIPKQQDNEDRGGGVDAAANASHRAHAVAGVEPDPTVGERKCENTEGEALILRCVQRNRKNRMEEIDRTRQPRSSENSSARTSMNTSEAVAQERRFIFATVMPGCAERQLIANVEDSSSDMRIGKQELCRVSFEIPCKSG